MRQHDLCDTLPGVRAASLQPGEFGHSKGRNRDAANCVCPCCGSTEPDFEIFGIRSRFSVVPQLGGVYGSGVLVESYHAVLLSCHANGRNCWCAGLYPRRIERRPPAFRVLFTHRRDDVWMRSGRRGNHLPRCKISDFDLRRLGGRVNSGNEGHLRNLRGRSRRARSSPE